MTLCKQCDNARCAPDSDFCSAACYYLHEEAEASLPPSRGDEAPATTSKPDFAGASSASVPAPTKVPAAGCDESVREVPAVGLPDRCCFGGRTATPCTSPPTWATRFSDGFLVALHCDTHRHPDEEPWLRDPGTSQRAGNSADATAPTPAAAPCETKDSESSDAASLRSRLEGERRVAAYNAETAVQWREKARAAESRLAEVERQRDEALRLQRDVYEKKLAASESREAAARRERDDLAAQVKRWEDKEVARASNCCGAEEQAAAARRGEAEAKAALLGLASRYPPESGEPQRFCDHAAEPCPRCEAARAVVSGDTEPRPDTGSER